MFNEAAAGVPSLRDFYDRVGGLDQLGFPYTDMRLNTFARHWGLARCGHHAYTDGRSARHRGAAPALCPCGLGMHTFAHALAECPLTAHFRWTWASQVCLAGLSDADVSAACLENWIFDPSDSANTVSTVAAHISFVGRVCMAAAANHGLG